MTEPKREIYIARHGHREDFAGAAWTETWKLSAGRRYDPALSARGVVEARQLGRRLRGRGIERVFTSPFLRTVETGHLVAEIIGVDVAIEEGLSEWLNPVWFSSRPELLSPARLKDTFPRIDVSYRSRVERRYPEVDEETDVWPHVRLAVQEILRNTTGTLLLVGHGASVGGAVRSLCGPDVAITADTGALFHCREEPGVYWEALLSGCTAHLAVNEERP